MRYFLIAALLINTAWAQQRYMPEISGEFVHIFNPNDTRPGERRLYTNDHALVKDDKGVWHAYGIMHHLPVQRWDEHRFFHPAGTALRQSKWEDHDDALTAKPGVEKVLWAPR